MELVATQYKQTEVGLIPEDWSVLSIEELSTRIGDGIHSTPKYSEDGKYYFINGNNLIGGKIVITTDTKRVDRQEYLDHQRPLNQNTILLSINGTIGNTAFYNNENVLLGKSAAYINLKESVNTMLVYFFFDTDQVKKYIDNELTGSTIKNLGLGAIRRLKIPIPTLHEQQAIAQVLSDTDKLIKSLEKKIAKKKLIKQGVMQALLTPKEGWEVKKLGDVLKVCHGKAQHEVENPNGKYPILGTGGLMSYSNDYLYNKPSVLIGRKGTIDKPQYMDTPFWTVDTLFYTSINEDYDPMFIFYVFQLIDWYAYNEASGVPSLNARTIEKIERYFPNKETQISISGVIRVIELDIDRCEKTLSKYKFTKQGMMQQLLTGKIRLV